MDEPKEQDHYRVLNIKSTATIKEIRTAARKLYLRNHRDKGGDSQVFVKIRLAEETLTDAAARSRFDRHYSSLCEKWRAYDAFKKERRWQDEEAFRRREEEARLRTQETLQRAQEAYKRAAQARLHRIQKEEERLRKLKQERLEAQEREKRIEAEKDRLSKLEKEAEIRTEAAAKRRRAELQDQAKERLSDHLIKQIFQERSRLWTPFYQKAGASSETSPTQFLNLQRLACRHEFWARKRGDETCSICGKIKLKVAFFCLDCQDIRCQRCRASGPDLGC